MKKIFATFILVGILNSCSKQEFQQSTDSFKRADSLFTKANDGLKTLDSISKRVNDSNGITRKVLLPKIEKETKRIDSTLKSGSWKIDSLNKDLKEITQHVKTGTDVAKTLDSASQLLKKGENAISVLSKTADKILKRTQSQKSNSPSNMENQNNTVVIPPIVEKNPLVKTAVLEVVVDEISGARSILRQKVRANNAELVSENFSQQEGFEREYVTVKVPLSNFDNFVSSISDGIGEVKSKSIESVGKDYISNQICEVKITLVQKELNSSNQIVTNSNNKDTESFGSKSSSAFMSGFKVLGDIMIAILPFWPIFIIAGLILYFVRKNKKKKELTQLENQNNIPVQKTEVASPSENIDKKNPDDSEEQDYSKYLPKK